MAAARVAVFVFVALAVPLVTAPAGSPLQSRAPTREGRLGTVHFVTSCTAQAQPPFDKSVALLHSFEFGPAIASFEAALAADPGCAMAHWGIALCRWGNPFAARQRSAAELRDGLAEIERAKRTPPATDRERGYLAAAERLYADHDRIDQGARIVAYERAMAELAHKYPADHEASIFYALALAAAAPPSDKTYANQLKAGAILERLYPEEPDHPGLAHYIIHAYDVPPLAGHALDAARRYGLIAPDAPHALHMPSHTFTRLGYWQESIDANLKSAAAARRAHETFEELHALDYQAYAYLQTGQDNAARRLLESLDEVSGRSAHAVAGAAPPLAGSFALAAIPARYALERRAWREAAVLRPHPSNAPHTEAMTWFARALGAAHTGDLRSARESVAALDDIRQRLTRAQELYWADQVAIQHRAAQAWLAFAEGRREEALRLMEEAANQEDRTEKNAITPGPLAPARELLGDMLVEVGRPAAARIEYAATLQKEPNRFRAVYGAAHSASLAGDTAGARAYYEQLARICERGDSPGRPELQEARKAAQQVR